jgi:hypothetical protein
MVRKDFVEPALNCGFPAIIRTMERNVHWWEVEAPVLFFSVIALCGVSSVSIGKSVREEKVITGPLKSSQK